MQNTQYNVPNEKNEYKIQRNHNAYRLCSSDYMKYFNETDIDQAKQLCILSAKRALHPTSIEAELMLQATRGGDSWHEQLISLSVAVCSETRPMRVSRRGARDWQGSGDRLCCIAPIGWLGRPYWCYYERHPDTLYIYWAQLSRNARPGAISLSHQRLRSSEHMA